MDWYVVSEWRLLPVARVADVIAHSLNCTWADALCLLAKLAEVGAPGLDLLQPDSSAHDTVRQLLWDESQAIWRSIADEAERARVGDNNRLAESPSRDWFLGMSGIEQLANDAGIGTEISGLLLGLVPGATERAHLREVQGRPEPNERDLAVAMLFAEPSRTLTPQEQADGHRGWYDETMDADHWFSLADVEPVNAAMLLCQFNPNDDTLAAAELSTNDETGPRDLVKLRQKLEDLRLATEPRPRTLADWLGVVRQLKLKHHSWIDTYVAAVGIQVAETLGGPPEAVSMLPPVAEPAPAGAAVGAAVAGPSSLTTPQIADAFDGIGGLSAKEWSDKLGDVNNHQWLLPARAARGSAPRPSTWWPLRFADLLEKRGTTHDSLNRAFLGQPALKPWLAEWQEAKRERNAFGE